MLNFRSGTATNNDAIAEYDKNNIAEFKSLVNLITGLDEKAVDDIKAATDVVAYYNHALIYFFEKKYTKALKVLQAIQTDLLDEKLAQKITLLAVNLYLSAHQYKAANKLAVKLSTYFDRNDGEDDSKQQKQPKLDDFQRICYLTVLRAGLMSGKPVLIPSEDDAEFSILRAHMHYFRHDFQMAAKELAKQYKTKTIAVLGQGECQNVCIANNLGLIHFSVRHFAIAVRFLQQALKFDQESFEKIHQMDAISLHCINATRRTEILYNLGLALLHLGRPKDAFNCLLIPLQRHQNNPRLWLRLAEACIMLYKEKLDRTEAKSIIHKIIGSGIYTKVILSPAPKKSVPKEHQSFVVPSPTIEFAALCLRNAVALVEFYADKRKEIFKDDNKNGRQPDGINCEPSRPLTKAAFEKLQCAVLAAYSYVLLAIGDFVLALKYGKELLAVENLPESYAVLGHLYCAEAMIMLDRVTEACMFLEPKFIKTLNGKDFETRNWHIKTLEAGQAVLTYNLAVTLAIQGDFKLAKKILYACKHPAIFNHYKLLETYLDLQSNGMEVSETLVLEKPNFFGTAI